MMVSKEKVVEFIRSEMEILAEQSDENEALSYVHRIKGYFSLITMTGIMSLEEARDFGEEFARARLAAEASVNRAKRY